MYGYICKSCKGIIDPNEKSTTCDGLCQGKFHNFCTKLSSNQLEIISACENITWKCEDCLNSKPKNLIKISNGSTDIFMDQFEARLSHIETMLFRNRQNGSSNDPPPHSFKYMFNRKAVLITSTIIGLTILVGILTVTVNAILDKSSIRKSKLLGDGDDSRKNIPINSTIELSDDEYKFNGTLLMIHRDEWLARPRPNELTDLKLPVHRVIISHTASDTCETKRICDHRVQIIQSFHMDSFDWDDVGYNFLVSSDGLVYEGRGWDKQGAHTKGYNVDSVGVAFIGTFLKMEPTKEQLEAAQLLLEDGVKRKKLVPDYRLYGARQMSGTESPGEALYRIIRKWPHWSPKI